MHLISWALPPGETDKPVSGKPSLHVESPKADGEIKLGVEPAPIQRQPVQPKPVAGNPPGETGKPVSEKPSAEPKPLPVESNPVKGQPIAEKPPARPTRPTPVNGDPVLEIPPAERSPRYPVEPPRTGPVGPISSLPRKGDKESTGSDLDLGLGRGQQKQNYSGAVQPVDGSKGAELGDSTRENFLNPGKGKMSSGGLKENSQTIGVGFGKVGGSEPSADSEISLGVQPPGQALPQPPAQTKPQPPAQGGVQPPKQGDLKPPASGTRPPSRNDANLNKPGADGDSDIKLGVQPLPSQPVDSGEPELGLEKPKKPKQPHEEAPITGTPVSGSPQPVDPTQGKEKDKSKEDKAEKPGLPVGQQPPTKGTPFKGAPVLPEQPPAETKDPEPPRAGPVGPISSLPRKGDKESTGSDLDLGLGRGQQKQNYSGAVQPVDGSKGAELGDSTRENFLNPGRGKMSSGGLKENSQTIGVGFGKVGGGEPSADSEISLGVQPPGQALPQPPAQTKPQPPAQGEAQPPTENQERGTPTPSLPVSSIGNNNQNYSSGQRSPQTGRGAEFSLPGGPVRENTQPVGDDIQLGLQPPTESGATPPARGGAKPPVQGDTQPPAQTLPQPPTQGDTQPPTQTKPQPPAQGEAQPPTENQERGAPTPSLPVDPTGNDLGNENHNAPGDKRSHPSQPSTKQGTETSLTDGRLREETQRPPQPTRVIQQTTVPSAPVVPTDTSRPTGDKPDHRTRDPKIAREAEDEQSYENAVQPIDKSRHPQLDKTQPSVEDVLAAIPVDLPISEFPKPSPNNPSGESQNIVAEGEKTQPPAIRPPSAPPRKPSVNFSRQTERRKGPRFVSHSSHQPAPGPTQEDTYWSAQGPAAPKVGPKAFETGLTVGQSSGTVRPKPTPPGIPRAQSVGPTSAEDSDDGVVLFQKRTAPSEKLRTERTLFQKTGETSPPERSFDLMSDDWRRLDHEQKRVKKTLLEIKNTDIDIGRVDMTDDSTKVYAQLLSHQKSDPASVSHLAMAFKERTGRQLIIRVPEAPTREEPSYEVRAVKKSKPQTLRKAQDKTVSHYDYEELKKKKKEEDEEEFEAYKKVVKKKEEHEQKLYVRASSEESSSWLAQSKTKKTETVSAEEDDDSALKKIRGRGKAQRGSGRRVVSNTGGGGGGGRLSGAQKPRKTNETDETKEKKELKDGELTAVLQENLDTDTGLKIKIVRVGLQELEDQERQQSGGGAQENGTCSTCGTELPPAQAQNCPVCAQSAQEIVALTKTNYRFAGAKMFATADSVVASEQAKQLFTTEKLASVASLRYWPKIPGHKEILQLRRATDEAS